MDRIILHSDMNNFYATVECSRNPSLRGRPVAVAGDPESRHGIVLAKSQEAKKFGVATGEALWQAKKKCPDIVFVPPHYDLYMEYSREAKKLYGEYTDMVESFGLDECWLDVTSSRRLFGDGTAIANDIRDKIKKRLGVTVSIGVSFNKIFAKLGSDMKKPDAVTVILRENFKEKIWHLCASELLYVGPATAKRLAAYDIRTIGDLANVNPIIIHNILGKNGDMLRTFARGEDTSAVSHINSKSNMKSVSCGSTAPRDLVTDEDVKVLLAALSTNVSRRLRASGMCAACVQLQVRDSELNSFVRQKRLAFPLRTGREIFDTAYGLYLKNARGMRLRSMSIGACELCDGVGEQMSFSPEIERVQKREQLESAFDALRNRYGDGVITKGVLMCDAEIADIGLKSSPGILPGMMNR